MRDLIRRSLIATAGLVLLLTTALDAEAARSRDRDRSASPGKSGTTSSRPATTAGKSARSRTQASTPRAKAGRSTSGTTATRGTRTQATGTATYGHGGRRVYVGAHGGRYGYYGYYGSPYYWGYGYGWPWYGYGYSAFYPVYVQDSRGMPAVIETDIKPKKAEVWLDGEPIGQARDYNGRWDLLYLKPGRHTLEFRHDDREALVVTLEARAGRHYVIEEALARGDGTRELAMGHPPRDETRASTPPPPVRDDRPSMRLEEGALTRGLLKIDVLPGDAAIYLDGEFLASAGELSRLHGSIPVAVGVHVIEVTMPGYRSERREVEVREGTPQRVEVALKRK